MRNGHEVGQEVFGCAIDRVESLFVSFEGNTSGTHVSKKPKVKLHVDTVRLQLRISTEGSGRNLGG